MAVLLPQGDKSATPPTCLTSHLTSHLRHLQSPKVPTRNSQPHGSLNPVNTGGKYGTFRSRGLGRSSSPAHSLTCTLSSAQLSGVERERPDPLRVSVSQRHDHHYRRCHQLSPVSRSDQTLPLSLPPHPDAPSRGSLSTDLRLSTKLDSQGCRRYLVDTVTMDAQGMPSCTSPRFRFPYSLIAVHVTLTALNGDIYPAERILNLRPDRPVICVGRASKSINKGIVGAADNAWFDSPVMSRNHAELSLNLEDNV